ncbi:MAG: ABC transporter ATP-binding protein [Myxococcales bacterium]|nr:ABC transporter ATP-binding protein [Myxococcales bacterium]
MTSAVSVENLTKVYTLDLLKGRRRVVALEGLTLSIGEGHVMGVLGPNGAGKSTTIKLLLNLIRPSSGTARVFGFDPASADARRHVGYLPENPAPYEYLTGEEFVRFAGSLSGLAGAELTRRVKAVLEQVQMDRFTGVQIRRFSKGMTQRIALAQALVSSPRLLILDEPTSGLDVLGRQLIRDIIVAEKKKGTTVLLCSHIIPDVEALAEDVAILIGGKLVRAGPVSEMLSAEGSHVELVFEGVDPERLAALKPEVIQAGRRLILRTAAADARAVIEAAHQAQGQLISMQPIRNSLEDTFLEAVRSSQNKVGSTIE